MQPGTRESVAEDRIYLAVPEIPKYIKVRIHITPRREAIKRDTKIQPLIGRENQREICNPNINIAKNTPYATLKPSLIVQYIYYRNNIILSIL